jgi:predicted RNA-binding protein with PIN domain
MLAIALASSCGHRHSWRKTAMGLDILVDGYNIIKNSPLFQPIEARNLEAARSALITQLVQRYRHTPHRVIVVFDGIGNHEQESHEKRIRIIFSRYDQTADSVIKRLAVEAERAGRTVEMYSNDRDVQQAVANSGGGVRSVSSLTDQFNAPSRDVARRAKYRIAMRKKYGLDPNYDPDDEPEHHPHGSKSRKKRR